MTDDPRLIVEIGCGPSGTDHLDTSDRPLGVDVDLSTLRAIPDGPGRRRNVCADALALPIRSSTCDLLILETVLHHLAPIGLALQELVRVLCPNGQLRVTDGVALASDDAAALDTELRAAGLPPEPVYGFDLNELRSAITEVGLDVTDVQIVGRSTFATPPFVSRTYSTERFTLTARKTTTA